MLLKSSMFQEAQAMVLKEQKGVLALTNPATGRLISQEVKDLVQQVYFDGNYSWQMPGKKDYVSIGKKFHMFKQLILCNL